MRYKKDDGSSLYQSHPWIMELRPDGSAFGLLFDSTWKAELDCRNGVFFTAEGPAFPVAVIDRDSPAAVLAALGELAGRMALPPLWALGYQQCRWSYSPDTRVKEIADEFRAHKLPCDVLWIDIDYMDGYRCFTFDKTKFPDPKGLNDYLHQKVFRSVWMIDPGIKVDNKYSV
jgi:alpha-glucosidase